MSRIKLALVVMVCVIYVWGLATPPGGGHPEHWLRHDLHFVLSATDGDDPDSERESMARVHGWRVGGEGMRS